MNLWQRFTGIVGDSAEAVGVLFDRVASRLSTDPEARRHMHFSIAIVALAAKMAKADGVVTLDEVAAFRKLVEFPDSQARHIERLFEIARRDVDGYQSYASKVARLYEAGDPIFADIIDALFVIAKADHFIHEAELAYLEDVAQRFGLSEAAFAEIAARHVAPEEGDPYLILGADRDDHFDDLRARYRRLVAEHHPDRLIARGVPAEFIAIGTQRLASINNAWDQIEAERRPA